MKVKCSVCDDCNKAHQPINIVCPDCGSELRKTIGFYNSDADEFKVIKKESQHLFHSEMQP